MADSSRNFWFTRTRKRTRQTKADIADFVTNANPIVDESFQMVEPNTHNVGNDREVVCCHCHTSFHPEKGQSFSCDWCCDRLQDANKCRLQANKLYHTSSNWRTTRRVPYCSRFTNWFPWDLTSVISILFLLVACSSVAECCSSKSTPKPRPSSPTQRPNVSYQTYTCPPDYAAMYCLNGATCFFVKLQHSILYNCECTEGYVGSRCEFKDLDGSYSPARNRVILETASIAGGACAVILATFFFSLVYVIWNRNDKKIAKAIDKKPFCQNMQKPQLVCTVGNTVYNIEAASKAQAKDCNLNRYLPQMPQPVFPCKYGQSPLVSPGPPASIHQGS